MLVFLLITAAVASYLWDGLNVSIILSNLIYHEDIRTKGSGNPGFTNFKRAFGSKWAWPVFFLDIIKTAVPMVVFGLLFRFSAGSGYHHQNDHHPDYNPDHFALFHILFLLCPPRYVPSGKV